MLIEVVHAVNGTTHTHKFTGENVSRQLDGIGLANIVFKDGTGRDHLGRKVLTAQYSDAFSIITYDEG